MRKKIIFSVLFITSIVIIITAGIFVYREWAPEDNFAATVYYLSPNGSDSNSGTTASPWKTIVKANSTISTGDTVILKDGVYQGNDQAYISLDKTGTTWRAENRHMAIIDGGFSPTALNGEWSNIKKVADDICGINGEKANSFSRLLYIDADNITIDGLFIRNSCGGGFSLKAGADNISIINSKVDWTFIAGLSVGAQPNEVNNNINIINNEFTRISFNDRYASFAEGYCSASDPKRDYCVNISWQLAGENLVIRNNVIAWGRGEVSTTGSRNVIFEDNIVIGNKNNFYSGNAHDVIVRNNLFWSPDSQLNPNTHWEKKNQQDSDWHLSSRNEGGEDDNPQNELVKGLKNFAFYNNLIINNAFEFNGYHKDKHSDAENMYFGNNTLIALPDTNNNPDKNIVFEISYGAKASADGDSKITGIIENNIIDVNKERDSKFVIGLSGNDQVIFRNNLLPPNVDIGMKGDGDVYSLDTGLVNVLAQVDFPIPAVGASSVDVEGLRNAINLDNYRLKSNSLAINAGTNGGGIGELTIPQLARSKDYFENPRLGIPDLGAIESSSENAPDNTPIPTPTYPSAKRIIVRAKARYPRSESGVWPKLEIKIGDPTTTQPTVHSFDVMGTTYQNYRYIHNVPFDVTQVKIKFVNDAVNRDVYIDKITIGTTVYQTEDPDTFSTGTWNNEVGACVGGFYSRDLLYCNGYFQYKAR